MIRDEAFERAWAVNRAKELIDYLKHDPDLEAPAGGDTLRGELTTLWLELDEALDRN
jgi:hypothetical protein